MESSRPGTKEAEIAYKVQDALPDLETSKNKGLFYNTVALPIDRHEKKKTSGKYDHISNLKTGVMNAMDMTLKDHLTISADQDIVKNFYFLFFLAIALHILHCFLC